MREWPRFCRTLGRRPAADIAAGVNTCCAVAEARGVTGALVDRVRRRRGFRGERRDDVAVHTDAAFAAAAAAFGRGIAVPLRLLLLTR